jgi:hypothetical protein
MHVFRALAVSALAAAHFFVPCTPAHAESAGTAFVFPAELAGFSRGSQIDFEGRQPGLGIGIPYSAEGMQATVYVYDNRVVDLPEGIESSVFRTQALQAEGDVVNTYRDVRVLSAPARGSGHCGNFLRTKFSFASPRGGSGGSVHSYLYLGSRKGNFVKARITYPADASVAASDAAQERFTQALCKLVSE